MTRSVVNDSLSLNVVFCFDVIVFVIVVQINFSLRWFLVIPCDSLGFFSFIHFIGPVAIFKKLHLRIRNGSQHKVLRLKWLLVPCGARFINTLSPMQRINQLKRRASFWNNSSFRISNMLVNVSILIQKATTSSLLGNRLFIHLRLMKGLRMV